ncbi:MAG TPA: branched-chain amino acid ABC transporter substrate-binding protein [Beijerinckiaceae bacterium]|jgi:ABC transporter substrate binding protein (PQQ-dependent alcohol dehydrogenase system)|nr:transporter substrate-binding protein [Microvirga sp.]HZB39172.1 branched-chain amino acid ABC transporter substrate-binding protein [Beijerinckiaceae bacterium]
MRQARSRSTHEAVFRRRLASLLGSALLIATVPLGMAEAAAPDTIRIGYLHQERAPASPASPLDELATEEGLAGARLGIADNAATGRFIGQSFVVIERRMRRGDDPVAAVAELAAEGVRFVITDLDAEPLRLAAGAAPRLLFLNARAPDDALRAQCRNNLLHTVPSRAMLADGLAQYLVWKRWRRWFLVVGQGAGDVLYAEAVRRAAKRFGAEIVIEKAWSFQYGPARADTGHVTLQTEIPAFTNVADHDVLVVADEANAFGDYLDGRTARPRPVAGTHHLVATGWSAVNEQWGATQLASRFAKLAGRRMTAVDYAAWAAVRSVGEAATRSRSADPDKIAAYLRGPAFLMSGFKGRGQSFREWDGQMRQPILIAGPRLLVSASPQPGFLHRVSELDTLGVDREESPCKP